MTTQPPTAAELARARREGRAPVSEIAVAAAAWGAALVTVPALGVALRGATREMLAQAARADVDPWRAASAITAGAVAPLGVALGAVVAASAAATVAQTRGARRAAESAGRTGEPGAATTALVTTAYGAVVLLVGATAWTRVGSPSALAGRLGATLAALGAVDLGWRWWRWRRALATTAAERRRTQRDDEGDPAVKRERARRMR